MDHSPILQVKQSFDEFLREAGGWDLVPRTFGDITREFSFLGENENVIETAISDFEMVLMDSRLLNR